MAIRDETRMLLESMTRLFEDHCTKQVTDAAETGVLPALELPEPEQRVLATLDGSGRGVDEVIRESGLPASAVNVALFSLEMKRLIRQLPGRLYMRNQ